jgi:LuxR family maltose regulon positive regulatory protein
MAAPEEYVRAFVDAGPALAPLLGQARDVNPDFVDRLLPAFEDKGWRAGREEGAPRPAVPIPGPAYKPALPLIEPLSNRELEVVGLIAAGLTNREIARELVIAVGTVKRHTNNIYGKLGVQNRTQAVARVREIGLL